MDLFETLGRETALRDKPLADLVRPKTLDEFIGQEHLVGEGQPLRRLMENRRPISMILWGPPGSGKTTLARIYAWSCDAEFVQLSAVASGVGEVRKVIEKAQKNQLAGLRTILFIDEIHRFNKAQQDSLLQSIEEGTIFFLGATTENPSFEIISPLLSRCRIYVLNPLSETELDQLLTRALPVLEKKIGAAIELQEDARKLLLQFANGDARELLNGLELSAFLSTPDKQQKLLLTVEGITQAFQRKTPHYDKKGDTHYDTISAFIKSVRGSDPNAALHYLARMIEAGEDPRFIARRLIILASEDIGNAEPMGLVVATSAFQAVNVIGMPEAQIILAQATTFLASAPKSNASYVALQKALKDVRTGPQEPIPLHLRNAPTRFMAEQGYGKGYRYPHDFPGAFVPEEYLPKKLQGKIYYLPTSHGAEKELLNRLKVLWPWLYDARPNTSENEKDSDES